VSRQIITGEGDMLDAIAWREYGSAEGALVLLLEANPHVLDPAQLPEGLVVTLPDLPKATQTVPVIRLWDAL
jgi:phage tail protein X